MNKTAEQIFNEHSWKAIGAISPSKDFCLSAMKEIASLAFDAGCKYGDANCELGGESRLPNKEQFLSQLFNDKMK